jgi:hypothetical protein
MKQYMSYVKSLVNRMLSTRDKGLRTELEFWNEWLMMKGDKWNEDYNFRSCKDSPVSEWHSHIIDTIPFGTVHVLDVGAGPLTSFGYRHHEKSVIVVAIDSLADEYNKLLDQYEIEPIVHTIRCDVEQIDNMFSENSFDIVNARNCLDHTVNPIHGLKKMLYVCKRNSYITLLHAQNEATTNNYYGLHQWNFSLKDSFLYIASESSKFCLDIEFDGLVSWTHELVDNAIRSVGVKI